MNPFLSSIIIIIFICSSCKHKRPSDPMDYTLSEASARKEFFTFKSILYDIHPSLTLYNTKDRIDFLFDSISKTYSGATSFRDFYNSLCFITDEIGCSHTEVYLPIWMSDTLQNRGFFFPYPVTWIDDKLLVNQTDAPLIEGTEILSINGMSSRGILNQLSCYNRVEGIHRAVQQKLAAKNLAFQFYLKWGVQSSFLLEIKDTSGVKSKVTLNPLSKSEWDDNNYNKIYYYDPTSLDYDLYLNDDANYAVMKVSTFDFIDYQQENGFENFCKNSFDLLDKKKAIKNLIIDLRENTGGSLRGAFLLFSYLTPASFSEYELVSSKINQLQYEHLLAEDFYTTNNSHLSKLREKFARKNNGLYFLADSLINKWEPDKLRFGGRVFVITNASTVSTASYFALMVKNSGRGKIVGDETSGGSSSGNGFTTLEYVLPETQIRLWFPYAHLVYTMKDEVNTGRGIIPNHIIPDSHESFKNNQDRQLNYILDSLILN